MIVPAASLPKTLRNRAGPVARFLSSKGRIGEGSGRKPKFIKVRVITKSARRRLEKVEDGSYRVHLVSAPEKGRANTELVEIMADHLGLKKSEISIVRGAGSRHKIIRV